MPQFAVKDLLFATAYIAIGIVMLLTLLEFPPQPGVDALPVVVLWFGGGAMIGAGAMWPLKCPLKGAAIGVLVQFLLAMGFLPI